MTLNISITEQCLFSFSCIVDQRDSQYVMPDNDGFSCCTVFEAMFCGSGDYKETSEDVVITDIEPEVFREMIRYNILFIACILYLYSPQVFPVSASWAFTH